MVNRKSVFWLPSVVSTLAALEVWEVWEVWEVLEVLEVLAVLAALVEFSPSFRVLVMFSSSKIA